MSPFDIAYGFIAGCSRADALTELTGSFERALQDLGFRYYACGSHVDPLKPEKAVMVLNYPRAWVEDYSNLQLHRVDPVFQRAGRSRLPFFWDAPDFRPSPSQRRMLSLANSHGVAHGYTIPIHEPAYTARGPSSCSLIPDSPTLDERCYLAAQLMAYYLFNRAAQLLQLDEEQLHTPTLPRRERECLELAATGKCDWSIAKLLGLSEATVHNHIEHAKSRLRVSTRIQAVVHALASGQIAYGEVVHRPTLPRRLAAALTQVRSMRN